MDDRSHSLWPMSGVVLIGPPIRLEFHLGHYLNKTDKKEERRGRLNENLQDDKESHARRYVWKGGDESGVGNRKLRS
jgi:hypothetical protein